MNRFLTLAIAAAPLAAPLILPTPAAAQTSVPVMVPTSGTILDVTAQGMTTRTPDVATIRAGVVSQGTTAAAALSDNAQRMTRVLGALKRAGIGPRDIATSTIGLAPQYRYVENQAPVVTGYQANNSVSIRFRDVAKSGTILDALVAEGANQIDGPNLSIDEPDAALDEARVDAVKRACARADLYARAAGMSVTRIVSIAEDGQNAGSPNPGPVFLARASAMQAKTEIAPGEKDVTVTLSVRFLLQ